MRCLCFAMTMCVGLLFSQNAFGQAFASASASSGGAVIVQPQAFALAAPTCDLGCGVPSAAFGFRQQVFLPAFQPLVVRQQRVFLQSANFGGASASAVTGGGRGASAAAAVGGGGRFFGRSRSRAVAVTRTGPFGRTVSRSRAVSR